MLISSAFFAAIAVCAVGFLILWSNPTRLINRLVFLCSIHIAIWLVLLHFTFLAKEGLFWLRWLTGFAAFIPLHFWLVKEAIIGGNRSGNLWKLRASAWVVFALVLGGICFTDFFIPSTSTSARRVYGPGYYLYIVGVLALYAALGIESARKLKILGGVKRVELQVWLGGGCAAAGTILMLMGLGAITHQPVYVRLQPFVVLIYYTATSLAITTNRLFDARQILIVSAEKAVLVLLSAGVAYVLDYGLVPLLPSPFDFLVTTGLTLWFASSLNGWLNRTFQFYPQATTARQAAFAAAGTEAQIDRLELTFLTILRGWGQTDHAAIASGSQGAYIGGEIDLPADSCIAQLMRQIRWATPERLARERPAPARVALAKFLEDHRLGVLVACEGLTLNALVGVGIPASRRPFTYPQVLQLLELAAIIENALERANLSAKAQHAEQLATVGLLGASLAHEIRNPLVSIKTFVQLLPHHYQDQAFRDKFFRLISDEVTRIDRLTEQLLDLASPRVYLAKMIELHAVLRESLDLVAAKAIGKNVELKSDFQASPDAAHADPAAVKQVLLNLCFNAIQAVETQFGERWVQISTRNTGSSIELSVSDSGPGISSAIWPKLFQPFQTTKSSGFGLGLAICKDILTNLQATIAVDQPVPGRGATFRVNFPCRP